MKLNNRIVARLELPDGKADQIEWDDDLRGYGYRLRRSGSTVRKTFVCQYRHGGRTQRCSWSADRLTEDQARAEARKVLARVALGQNPQAERKATRLQEAHALRAIAEI